MEPAWEKVNGLKFQLVEYKDAKGELRPITRCQARCDKARWTDQGTVPVPLGNGNAVNQGLLREVFE
jgi:hypothetical protein